MNAQPRFTIEDLEVLPDPLDDTRYAGHCSTDDRSPVEDAGAVGIAGSR